jgi:hypothetical protein
MTDARVFWSRYKADSHGWYFQLRGGDPEGPFSTPLDAGKAARDAIVEMADADFDEVEPTGVFTFLVPVTVTVEAGRVTEVHVADETTPTAENSKLIEGDNLRELLAAANNGQDWPAWELGW